MAKSFHDLSQRSQLIVFVLLSVLTAAAAYQLLISPQAAELATARQQLAALEADLGRAQATAAKLPAAQRELKTLEAALRQTEAVIPEEKDPQDVLRNLHELASDSLLDIASFKPKEAVPRTQYTEWPIELGLEGSYHDLGRFFDEIAAAPRLMSISNLQIKTRVRPESRGSVTVSCVATTFVFDKETAPTGGVQ